MQKSNNTNLIILGIDPGYDRVGIGIIEKNIKNELSYVYSSTIETQKSSPFSARILQIETSLNSIINSYQPNLIVIESLFFAKNVKTAIDVAQARGSILLTCAKYMNHNRNIHNNSPESPNTDASNYNILELTPMQIKSSLVGDGHATKDRVEYMVYQILKLRSDQNFIKSKTKTTNDSDKISTKKDSYTIDILDDEIDALSIALAGERHHLHKTL